MKNVRIHCYGAGRLLSLFVALVLPASLANAGSILVGKAESTFPVLQTKTAVYTNVTVTDQTGDSIFIMHSTGVCSVKLSDLSPETMKALGLKGQPDQDTTEKKKLFTGPPLAKITAARIADVKKLATDWRKNPKEKFKELTTGNPMFWCWFWCIIGGIHLFVSTCFWLICRKTHISPGPLIWVPVFQIIPLLRAANMPLGWFFAYFVPALNVIAMIIWAFKIVQSRGKNPAVAFFLLLPITNVLAFLYLALSSSAPVRIQQRDIIALDFA